jgi:hypothetical protein
MPLTVDHKCNRSGHAIASIYAKIDSSLCPYLPLLFCPYLPLLFCAYSYVSLSQILKDATLFFSRGTPNLATVIPAMDHIDERFATDAMNSSYEPAIRASLGVAKATLNRYYNMTDHSEVYRIAMGKSTHFTTTTFY